MSIRPSARAQYNAMHSPIILATFGDLLVAGYRLDVLSDDCRQVANFGDESCRAGSIEVRALYPEIPSRLS
jgi:hypothetical protein